MAKKADFAKANTFLAFLTKYGPGNANIYDTKVLRKIGQDVYVWKGGADEFDFSLYFPIDNGGTPPYFRQRHQVSREEAAAWFQYRALGGLGDFEPWPLPTPKKLKRLADQATGDVPH